MQIAGAVPGPLIQSSDYGATWGQSSAGNKSWNGVAISGDGLRRVAVQNAGAIFISHDGGNIWRPFDP